MPLIDPFKEKSVCDIEIDLFTGINGKYDE